MRMMRSRDTDIAPKIKGAITRSDILIAFLTRKRIYLSLRGSRRLPTLRA